MSKCLYIYVFAFRNLSIEQKDINKGASHYKTENCVGIIPTD